MTYDAARPRYTLKLADKEYELVGTFELIEAVEYALKEGIIPIAVRIMDMGVSDTAKVIAAMLGANGEKIRTVAIGFTIHNELGIASEEYARLKLDLYAFLSILLAPPSQREAKSKQMGELTGKLAASPGKATRRSA